MEPNNLVVTVICARGLTLKGQTELNTSVTLCLQGKGSLRSKCVTEKVQGTTEAEWKESCEFKLMEGANKLTATVNHHTRLGQVDMIGKAEMPLSEVFDLTSPTWFPLQKKAKDDKYRGEVLIQFKFTYVKPQLSVSNLSLNTIPKDSVLSKMKKKMGKLGKGKDKDSISVFSAFAPSMHKNRSFASEAPHNLTFNEGSSIRSNSSFRRPSLGPSPVPLATSSPLNSPHQSPYVNHSSNLNLSGISTAESISNISTLQRHNSRRSFASSGFGSNKSKGNGPVEVNGTNTNGNTSEWDLASEIDRLRAEMAVKDSRLKDMEEYIDKLTQKVLVSNPELLAQTPPNRNFLPQRSYRFH